LCTLTARARFPIFRLLWGNFLFSAFEEWFYIPCQQKFGGKPEMARPVTTSLSCGLAGTISENFNSCFEKALICFLLTDSPTLSAQPRSEHMSKLEEFLGDPSKNEKPFFTNIEELVITTVGTLRPKSKKYPKNTKAPRNKKRRKNHYFPKHLRDKAAKLTLELLRLQLLEVVASPDPLAKLSETTQRFVCQPKYDKDDELFQGLDEQLACYVVAFTFYQVLCLAETEKQQWDAANLLYVAMLPIADERGGPLDSRKFVDELKCNGTETVIKPWTMSPPVQFQDAVKMFRGRAKFTRIRLIRKQNATQLMDAAGPDNIARQVVKRLAHQRLKSDQEYFEDLVGANLFALCVHASKNLEDPRLQFTALSMQGGLSHRSNVGTPWKDLFGAIQPGLFQMLRIVFHNGNRRPDKNFVRRYLSVPLSEQMENLDYLGQLAFLIHGEFSAEESNGEFDPKALTKLIAVFLGRDSAKHDLQTLAFKVFVMVGKAMAIRRLHNKVKCELPSDFHDASLAESMKKYLLNGFLPPSELIVGIFKHVCHQASRQENSNRYWFQLLTDLKKRPIQQEQS
jgi:hypothetical protein